MLINATKAANNVLKNLKPVVINPEIVNLLADDKTDITYVKKTKQEENSSESQKSENNAIEKISDSSFIPCSDYESLQPKGSGKLTLVEKKKKHHEKVSKAAKTYMKNKENNDMLSQWFSHMERQMLLKKKNKVNNNKNENSNNYKIISNIDLPLSNLYDSWNFIIQNQGSFLCISENPIRSSTWREAESLEKKLLIKIKELSDGSHIINGRFKVTKHGEIVKINVLGNKHSVKVFTRFMEEKNIEYYPATHFLKRLIPTQPLNLEKGEIYIATHKDRCLCLLGKEENPTGVNLCAVNIFAGEQEALFRYGFIKDRKRLNVLYHLVGNDSNHSPVRLSGSYPILHDGSDEALDKISLLFKSHYERTRESMIFDRSSLEIFRMVREERKDYIAEAKKTLRKRNMEYRKDRKLIDYILETRDLSLAKKFVCLNTKDKISDERYKITYVEEKDPEILEKIFKRIKNIGKTIDEENEFLNAKLGNTIIAYTEEIKALDKKIMEMEGVIRKLRARGTKMIFGVDELCFAKLANSPAIHKIIENKNMDRCCPNQKIMILKAVDEVIRSSGENKIERYYKKSEHLLNIIIKMLGRTDALTIFYQAICVGEKEFTSGVFNILEAVLKDIVTRYDQDDVVTSAKPKEELLRELARKLNISEEHATTYVQIEPVKDAFEGIHSAILELAKQTGSQRGLCTDELDEYVENYELDYMEVTMSEEELSL